MNDPRRCASVSFLLVVLLLSSGAFAPLWNDSHAHGLAETGDARLQVVWISLYGVAMILLVPHARRLASALATNKLLALLSCLCLVSAVWSENPAVTLRKACALVGTTLIGLLFALEFDSSGQVKLLASVLGLTAIASAAASLLFPDAFHPTEFAGDAWNGVFSHKNLLGRAMSLGTLAFLSLGRQSLRSVVLSLCGSVLCATMLFASDSQTALIVLAAVVLLAILLQTVRWPWRQATASLLFASLLAAPGIAFAAAHTNELANLLHRNATLTGRSRIWSFAILSFRQHPWLGYGYGSFWGVAVEARRVLAFIRYETPHAHNGFLDLGLQLGLTGVALMLAVCGMTFVRHLRRYREGGPLWPLLFVAFFMLYNLTENSWLLPNSLVWIVFCAIAFSNVRNLKPVSS